jgi:signal transduction histidine kinase/DNA-binding NarL/FixJ family response regulator
MKRFFKNMPIRRKVTFVILLTCVAALVTVGIALFAVHVFTFRQNFTANLRNIAEIIESNSTAALTFNDQAAATEILSSLKVRTAVTYASLDLPDGSLFAKYERAPHKDKEAVMPTEEGILFQNSEVILTERIALDGELIGWLHIHADYWKELRQLLLIYGGVHVGVLTLAIFLAFVLSGRLRGSISDPILGLAEVARAVSRENDYSVRAQKFDDDEIGMFTDAFNQMLTQIESQSAALQEGRDLLEARVVDRTAMLQKTNAELTIATAEAAAANRAKSEFLSRMSHELRTPMNAILGFGQLLEMKRNLDARQSESVGHILSAGRHLLVLIDEVLDISRIESGNMSLSLEAVHVRSLTQETIDLVRSLAVKFDVALVQTIPEDSQAHVIADRQRLRQTLLNLLSNAIKYNSAGGKVTISGDVVRREWSSDTAPTTIAPAGIFRIRIADTGIGISAEKQKRLFTPFDRLDAELTGVEGTGLGLALSKKMTELMGGTLGIESAAGQGSVFWVDLPFTECPVKMLDLSGEVAPSTVLDSPARTIVYIEDNLSNLKLIQAIFNLRAGIKLFTAMQGGLGIDLVREHSPDLVLLDLNLPDLTGQEVLARLRRDPTTSAVPVLMLTADATPGQKERLLAAGANGYLSKPINIPAFLKAVDEMLAKNASGRIQAGHAVPNVLPQSVMPSSVVTGGENETTGSTAQRPS